jgi:hypothetical protein
MQIAMTEVRETPLPDKTIYVGAGRCSKCTCSGYSKSLSSDNDYCECGHSYSDHW